MLEKTDMDRAGPLQDSDVFMRTAEHLAIIIISPEEPASGPQSILCRNVLFSISRPQYCIYCKFYDTNHQPMPLLGK